jgi:serine/threonine protein kinase
VTSRDIENAVLIGSGSFGRVFKVPATGTPTNYIAMKILHKPLEVAPAEGGDLASLLREISILKDLEHENIVKYLGSSTRRHDLMDEVSM